MNKNNRGRQKPEHNINTRINHREVRIVGCIDEDLNGVKTLQEALGIAEKKGLDLIEINSLAKPPVCRVEDYTKFKYDLKKRERDLKKNQPKILLKEIKFGPNTGDHDFDFKMKNAEKFITQGHKVKATVQFRGRENSFRDRGELLLLKLAEKLGETARVESLPQMNGRQMTMFLSPKK